MEKNDLVELDFRVKFSSLVHLNWANLVHMAIFLTQTVENFFSPWCMCTMQGQCCSAPGCVAVFSESYVLPQFQWIRQLYLIKSKLTSLTKNIEEIINIHSNK
jgi:hypothetical protein